MAIKQRDKSLAVILHDEMREFMKNDVVQTLNILFGEFQIEPDRPALRTAAAPFCLHPLDKKAIDFYA